MHGKINYPIKFNKKLYYIHLNFLKIAFDNNFKNRIIIIIKIVILRIVFNLLSLSIKKLCKKNYSFKGSL
jgi:hypothetical protein